MKTMEEIKAAIEAAVPGAAVQIVPNPSPSGQHALRLAPSHAFQVAKFLRDEMYFDFLSNATRRGLAGQGNFGKSEGHPHGDQSRGRRGAGGRGERRGDSQAPRAGLP